jgi:hypothetical protein
MKRAAYKEQATAFFEEASALNTDAAFFDLKKRILQGYVQLYGVREHQTGLNSTCPNFGPFWKSTASNIFQTSQHFKNMICLSAMKKPWQT